jgi:hypothetical protein
VIPLNSTPIIPQSGTSPVSFTDTSNLLYAQNAYYYVVKPIVDGLEVSASGAQNPTELKVVIPPDNMVLVHRWIANQSLCAMVGQSTRPNASYSCSFEWPGGGTTLDIGSGTQTGFFVDAFETGCNYSRGVCSNTGNSSKDCIGNGAPGALGVTAGAGSVYYDRYSGTCFVSASGSWVEAAGASQASFLALASNQPGLPPLVRAPQSQAAAACQAFQKFLPSRLQQLVAAEWSSSASNIGQLETGGGDNCNTDKAHGIAYETASVPNNLETLPFALASQGASPAAYTLRTGSASTAACVSRYGAQDLVGNVNEWAADQVFCSAFVASTLGGVGYNCYGTATNLNGATSEFNNVYLSNGNGSGTSDYWNLSASQALLAPLMAPVLTSAGYASQQPASLSLGTHQFRFFGGSNPGTRGVLTGGAWYGEDPGTGAQGAGRFSLDLSKFANTPDPSIGFRCVEPVM